MSHSDLNIYRLGLSQWSCASWRGRLLKHNRSKAPQADLDLAQYSQVFSSVAVPSTFDTLPAAHDVRRWCRKSQPGLQFILQFPRTVTHDALLQGPMDDLDPFLDLLGILEQHERLGPSLLQLPPNFDGGQIDVLREFLESLPAEFAVAVELQHGDWSDNPTIEQKLLRMLKRLKIDRCVRPFDQPSAYRCVADRDHGDDPDSATSSHRGNIPATGQYPMLWLNVDRDLSEAGRWISSWAQQVADWIDEGRQAHVIVQSAGHENDPDLAAAFHNALMRHVKPLPPLPPWPGKRSARQLELF